MYFYRILHVYIVARSTTASHSMLTLRQLIKKAAEPIPLCNQSTPQKSLNYI